MEMGCCTTRRGADFRGGFASLTADWRDLEGTERAGRRGEGMRASDKRGETPHFRGGERRHRPLGIEERGQLMG